MQRRPVRCKFLGAGDSRCASMGSLRSPIRPAARGAASASASCLSQSVHPCMGVLAEVGVSVNDQGDFQCDFVQCAVGTTPYVAATTTTSWSSLTRCDMRAQGRWRRG